jgi:hypothetical protein
MGSAAERPQRRPAAGGLCLRCRNGSQRRNGCEACCRLPAAVAAHGRRTRGRTPFPSSLSPTLAVQCALSSFFAFMPAPHAAQLAVAPSEPSACLRSIRASPAERGAGTRTSRASCSATPQLAQEVREVQRCGRGAQHRASCTAPRYAAARALPPALLGTWAASACSHTSVLLRALPRCRDLTHRAPLCPRILVPCRACPHASVLAGRQPTPTPPRLVGRAEQPGRPRHASTSN